MTVFHYNETMLSKRQTAADPNGLGSTDDPSRDQFTQREFNLFLKRLEEVFGDLENKLRNSRWKTENCEEHIVHILGHLLYDRMNPLGEIIHTGKRVSGRIPDMVNLVNSIELGQNAAVEIVVRNEPSIEKIRDLNAAGLPIFVLFWKNDPKQEHFEKKVQDQLNFDQPVRNGTLSIEYCGWTNPGDPIGYVNGRKLEPTEKLSGTDVFRRNLVPAYIEASGRVQRMTEAAAGFYRVSGLQVWDEHYPIIHVDGFGKSGNIEIMSVKDEGWRSLSPDQIIKAIEAGECKEIWPPHGIQWADKEVLKNNSNMGSLKRNRRMTSEDQCLSEDVTKRFEELPDNNRDLVVGSIA